MSVKIIDTILILGGTSGIGEAFVRHYHSKGKKVITAGRRIERLNALKSELKGLETVQLDVQDVQSLESKIQNIINSFPSIDSVFVISGKSELENFTDPSTTSTDAIISTVTINLTAPLLIARAALPHLLALKRQATFMTVSSGLAYIPLPMYPTYNATKSAIHMFTVNLRTQLAGTNVKAIELAPPYVDTDLNAKFREKDIELQGGKDKAAVPMPLKEYMDSAIAGLEKEDPKEVAVGFSKMGVDAWRGAFGPILENFGLAG